MHDLDLIVARALCLLSCLVVPRLALAACQPPTKPDYNPAGYGLQATWQPFPPDAGQFVIVGQRNLPSQTDPSTGRVTVYSGGLGAIEMCRHNSVTNSWDVVSRSGNRWQAEEETGPTFLRKDTVTFKIETTADRRDLETHFLDSLELATHTQEDWRITYERGVPKRKDGFQKRISNSDDTSISQGQTLREVCTTSNEYIWTGPLEDRWTTSKSFFDLRRLVDGVPRWVVMRDQQNDRTFDTLNGFETAERSDQGYLESSYFPSGEIAKERQVKWRVSSSYSASGLPTGSAEDLVTFDKLYFGADPPGLPKELEANVEIKVNGFVTRRFKRKTTFWPFWPGRARGGGFSFDGEMTDNGVTSKLGLEWFDSGQLFYVDLNGTVLGLPLDPNDLLNADTAYREFNDKEASFTKKDGADPQAYPYLGNLR